MSAGYAAMGVGALLGLVIAACCAMTFAARATARLFGVARFRWFDAHPAPASWWARLCIRTAATLVPFVGSALFFSVSLLWNGTSKTTDRVEVMDGPARDAGMLDGDRIVRVGARNVANWDEMRSAVQKLTGPTNLEVERNGSRLELLVTPRQGRISVTPQFAVEQVGVLAALAQGPVLSWSVLGASARSLVAPRPTAVELRGPVGIVREARANKEAGTFATYLAVLLTHLAPVLAGVCLFDALTLGIFQAWHPEAQSSQLLGYRLQRYRQALLIALGGYAVFALAAVLSAVGVPLADVVVVLAAPVALGGIPLLWLGSKEVGQGGTAVIGVLASIAVPCFMLAFGISLQNTLRRQLRAEGFRAGWLRAEPPSVPASGA